MVLELGLGLGFGRTLAIMNVGYRRLRSQRFCLIAFDRFTATFYPLWYRGNGRANSHHALGYAAVVWSVAAGACQVHGCSPGKEVGDA